MSWELSIWPANKSGSARVLTQAAPAGVDDGFKWSARGNRDNVQLQFNGRNDRVQIPARGIVRLSIDGIFRFYGVAADPPSTGDPASQTITVLGGREALNKALSDGKVYVNMGVYDIARDLLQRLCPACLTYDPQHIGDGTGADAGPTLTTFYKPYQPLDEVLDALATSASTTAGVDEWGRVFLGRPAAAALSVDYAGQQWRRLQVQGREAVTRAVLRLVSAPSLPSGASVQHDVVAGGQYLPRTIVEVAELPEHATYLAEKVVEVPSGLSAIKAIYPVMTGAANGVNGAATVDSDTSTFATLRLGYADVIGFAPPSGVKRVVGVQLRYELPSYTRQTDFDVAAALGHNGSTNLNWYIQTTQGVTTATAIVPPDATGNFLGQGADQETWSSGLSIGTAASTQPASYGGAKFYLYDVQLLVVDDDLAKTIAKSFLAAPFGLPAEVLLPQLADPTATVTVTNSPDGNLTGPVNLFEYEHSSAYPRTTRIKLGASGASDTARAIQFTAQAAARAAAS